ncbi:bifunctional 2-methylcitrate synthase/citrate synthase [Nocardia asteroides NBRC 15531]|uniref:Citrate synthase n=1 Tax=Nocardia asteroides NBRC 15531 TaxID=1110697 RepID=U5E344_NOCAS|nr:bifunctional 2-methylcitrate synthase/citrate synthase [Nocardia asteroides]TLF64702.1 bifunctional 2-methylcitrate synthase/citrate synthase [Nocardia asteroides NBRC 15531]UGT50173.1 bifunctional 2-methylcitrate synthase/citrate synthase [Nocardia asteroides]SFN16387.1 citrate synthase [Nocardia asteroides]VEG37057.1 Citrate synthase [Nocardia asteroides]GAD81887.1 2-methylcitrate synthase/citrate synthase [Nocardia asteroides NBRC 15531]
MTDSDIAKGLAGVVVDTTSISKVVTETNSLTYRGYPVQELAGRRTFEEVAYLLWYGELPDDGQRQLFCQRERAQRRIDRSVLALVEKMPDTCHPMDVVRTVVSYLGTEDAASESTAERDRLAAALRLTALLPTVIATAMRRRRGLDPIAPHPQLGFAENFLYMCFGEVPAPRIVRAFEISLILYAEHGFNASTFAARVVTSTGSDLYSAVTAAIGALKGRLHGGANEAVMHTMREIDDPDRAAAWVRETLAARRKVMGFGHRVYRHGDSRVPTMKAALDEVAEATGGQRWVRMYDALATAMAEQTGIAPNLDFPAGPAYHLMGFDIEMFTPIFVMSRITGWTAHIAEQSAANALIRPLSEYRGVEQRPVPLSRAAH